NRFDQAEIHAEAEAFAATIGGAQAVYGIDPARIVALGYSNGANFLAAVLALHPGIIRRAVLLRAIPVLEAPLATNLTGTEVLVVNGAQDSAGGSGPQLVEQLRAAGASVEAHMIAAGHELT